MAKVSTRNQKVGRDPPVEKHCFKCLICFIKVKYILYQGRQDSFDLGPNLEITFHLGQLYLPDLITYVQNSIFYTIHNLFFHWWLYGHKFGICFVFHVAKMVPGSKNNKLEGYMRPARCNLPRSVIVFVIKLEKKLELIGSFLLDKLICCCK